jgi:hypothetical protein
MSERKDIIRTAMQARHAESWPVLNGLKPETLDLTVYTHGTEEWTVRQVIAHLADAERGLLGQIQRLIAGKTTVPSDFDLQRWNRSAVQKLAQVPIPELLDQIHLAYQEALAFLDIIDEAALDLQGYHPSGELISAEAYFHRMADHRAEHASDIRQAINR